MKNGFSLVELSIVLVILGLLTGGILSGQSLIRAAELRAVATEYQRHIAAVQSFRDRYMALPGDFRDATKFWGRQVNAAHCATNSAAAVVASGTCDGSGNGLIEAPTAVNQSGEMFQLWKQLALAGLVEGTYTGLGGSGWAAQAIKDSNVPNSRLSNAAWGVQYLGNYAGSGLNYALDYGNALLIGSFTTISGFLPNYVLRPEEAWNIDTKLDDGIPSRGKIVASNWNNACAAADDGTHANNDLNASYKLSETSLVCTLYFVRAF